MIAFANCKINLGLWVLEKLPDSYHRIETVMVPLPLGDIIEIIPGDAGKVHFTLSGIALEGSPSENLCIRAWQLLSREYGIPPVRIHLHKLVPSGAGLGGGSSDAAFTLKMLNSLFNLKLTNEVLRTLASRLGMDCPFFIDSAPVFATGRGNLLEALPCPVNDCWIVLIKPPVSIKTAMAYADITPHKRDYPLTELLQHPRDEWRWVLENDFERNVFKTYPEVAITHKMLYDAGAFYAQMSGSGAAVFGLFSEKPHPIPVPEQYFSYTHYFGAFNNSQTATML